MKFLLDLHTHTIASGHAYSTVEENAAWAAKIGLQLIGIADHGPRMGSCPLEQFIGIGGKGEIIQGVQVYQGVEANILNEGLLDMPDDVLAALDFVIASMHNPFIVPGSAEENTDAVIRVMENPYVHIIGHVCDKNFPINIPRIVEAARRTGSIIEINNPSLPPNAYRYPGEEVFRQMLALCKEQAVPVIAGSDSHTDRGVGELALAQRVIEAAGIPERLVLNTDIALLNEWLSVKRQKHAQR